MLHAFQLHKELFRKYWYVRLFYSCCVKDVYNLLWHQGFIYHLTDSRLYFFICLVWWCSIKLAQACLHCLKERHFLFYSHGSFMRYGYGKCFRQGINFVYKTLFAVIKSEDEIFCLQYQRKFMRNICRKIRLIVESVKKMLHNFQLLVHNCHGFILLLRRIAFSSRIWIERQRLLQVGGNAQIVYYKSARFVLINSVYTRNSLHQVVPLHWLVYI